VFLLYGRRIATHSVDPSLTHFLHEFPGWARSIMIKSRSFAVIRPSLWNGLPLASRRFAGHRRSVPFSSFRSVRTLAQPACPSGPIKTILCSSWTLAVHIDPTRT